MKMKNETYDVLKSITLIWLPAISALYVGLSKIWGFPLAEEVAGSIALVCTFLGSVLQISTRKYWEDADVSTKN